MDEIKIEPSVVKSTGECHTALKWERVDEGVTEFVNGVKVNSVAKRLIAHCDVCNTTYKKTRIDPVPAEPQVVDLDTV